ncbi:DUF1499 domain-containing protein [Litorisediminicola beolgyonensis]|uniref:DUF1499 domain-containing protein n=1 Tax=Litorisediminicola beolgyonensis TaxID=1173614 RepID=A0ABW3ZKN3_9RHOB
MKKLFILLILAAIAAAAWVRLAPSPAEDWHVDPKVTADQDGANQVRRRIEGGEDVFRRLDHIILATPRTDLLAGSPEEGRVTYITRSKWMGFPDYTTIQLGDGVVELWSRSRFGQSDMGVNRARAEGWLQELSRGE